MNGLTMFNEYWIGKWNSDHEHLGYMGQLTKMKQQIDTGVCPERG